MGNHIRVFYRKTIAFSAYGRPRGVGRATHIPAIGAMQALLVWLAIWARLPSIIPAALGALQYLRGTWFTTKNGFIGTILFRHTNYLIIIICKLFIHPYMFTSFQIDLDAFRCMFLSVVQRNFFNILRNEGEKQFIM